MSIMLLEGFKKKVKKMPDTPGVYFFLDKRKKVLYIGKATSLRDRTRSYFAPDIAEVRSPLIARMVESAAALDWRATDSVLEALILEANLIKHYKPKFNTDLKDDKSWNYVAVTYEDFPRILLVRGKNLRTISGNRFQVSGSGALKAGAYKLKAVFGPFPHGLQLKAALKLIRKIFPYRDTCIPCELTRSHLVNKVRPCKRCFNAQMGLCPGVCSGDITKKEYRATIRHIALLFQGKKAALLKTLEREMIAAAKKEDFEEAARLRGKIFALKHIRDISLIKEEYRKPGSAEPAVRIEAYDAAHLAGSAAVGVMAVVEDGEARRSEYRKFTLRTAKAGDDAGALREILSRRLGHDEWPMPRLIVVDGGAAQINAAEQVLDAAGVRIPIVGVVKDEKHHPRNFKGEPAFISGREKEILLANAEAHRFAITYHRKRSRAERGIY